MASEKDVVEVDALVEHLGVFDIEPVVGGDDGNSDCGMKVGLWEIDGRV